MDDDPLTSPSFPAINAEDSRSYRTQRSGGHSAPAPGTGGFSEPAQQFSQYVSDGSLNGYSSRPAAASIPHAMPSAAGSAAPAGNPYGSFVSQPAAGYQDPATVHPAAVHPAAVHPAAVHPATQHPDAAGYGGYPAAIQQAPAANGSWYGAPADSYLSAPPANGAYQNGEYNPAAYQGTAYQPGQVDPAGYPQPSQLAGQYDQLGYAAPDLAYGRDGYQGSPGGYGGNQ